MNINPYTKLQYFQLWFFGASMLFSYSYYSYTFYPWLHGFMKVVSLTSSCANPGLYNKCSSSIDLLASFTYLYICSQLWRYPDEILNWPQGETEHFGLVCSRFNKQGNYELSLSQVISTEADLAHQESESLQRPNGNSSCIQSRVSVTHYSLSLRLYP